MEYHDNSIPFSSFEDDQNPGLARPWRAIWPPRKDSEVWKWLASNSPEALSWRYDAVNPFDRPWRTWTKSRANSCSDSGHKEMNFVEGQFVSTRREPYIDGDVARALPMAEKNPSRGANELEVQINIRHLAPLTLYRTEKPYLSRLPQIVGFDRTNIVDNEYRVTLQNVISNAQRYSLDVAGFEYRVIPFPITVWDDNVITEHYIPCVQKWLTNALGADYVTIYAFNFRAPFDGPCNAGPWKRPFFRAHCDATPQSCIKRLALMRMDGESSATRRVRFINVWRPLTGPYLDTPLAMCDSRTVRSKDLVAADIVFPHYCDEGFELLKKNRHKWVYKNPMDVDEVILLKLDDTDTVAAKCCPHSAFIDSTVPTNTPPRASIEVRAVVFGG